MLRGIRLAEQRSQRKVDSLARTLHTVPPDDLLDKVVINLSTLFSMDQRYPPHPQSDPKTPH